MGMDFQSAERQLQMSAGAAVMSAVIITATATGIIRTGDKLTFSGWGYDRKGREIRFGRFVATGKPTRSKIVRLHVAIAGIPT